MTLDHRLVILRMSLVVCALLASACTTTSLPRRIPVTSALPPPETGVMFDVHPIVVGADTDWELLLDGGGGSVLITPRRTANVPVPFGDRTVRATVTMFQTQAVTTTTKTQYGTQTHTTYVRSAVATCTATLDVTVNYIEPRRLDVDVARQDCAIREVEVSAY
jgi:hypothetical protein